jgi:hypothetical protein
MSHQRKPGLECRIVDRGPRHRVSIAPQHSAYQYIAFLGKNSAINLRWIETLKMCLRYLEIASPLTLEAWIETRLPVVGIILANRVNEASPDEGIETSNGFTDRSIEKCWIASLAPAVRYSRKELANVLIIQAASRPTSTEAGRLVTIYSTANHSTISRWAMSSPSRSL